MTKYMCPSAGVCVYPRLGSDQEEDGEDEG